MYLKARTTFKGLQSFPPRTYRAVEEIDYFIRGKWSHRDSQEAQDWHHLPPAGSWNQAGATDGISQDPWRSQLLLLLLQQLLAATRNHGNATGLKLLHQGVLVLLKPDHMTHLDNAEKR